MTHLCRLLVALVICLSVVSVRADIDDLGRRATWSQPSPDEVRAELEGWLAGHELTDEQRLQLDALWPPAGGVIPDTDLLEQVAATFAIVLDDVRPLVTLCSQEAAPLSLPTFELLSSGSVPDYVRNNLQLLYGRWLAQRRLFDEASEQLQSLQPEDVVDPASLLFYQGVVHHRLLKKDDCLPTVARLLENEDNIPQRYGVVARLMEADLKPLKPDSLDEIARLMEDIQRRLEFGRAGKRVRDEEDDVIAKLDKMIEEMEKQQQQQQQSGSGSGQNNPQSPMQDSTLPAGGGGPGNVDPNRIGSRSGWGNLHPKQREEVLNQISKDLPAHFREVIEEYFRKIARDSAR